MARIDDPRSPRETKDRVEIDPMRRRLAELREEVVTRRSTGLEADKRFFDELSGDI